MPHQWNRLQAFLFPPQPICRREIRVCCGGWRVFGARPMLTEEAKRLARMPKARMDRLALGHVDDAFRPEAIDHRGIQDFLQKIVVFHAYTGQHLQKVGRALSDEKLRGERLFLANAVALTERPESLCKLGANKYSQQWRTFPRRHPI